MKRGIVVAWILFIVFASMPFIVNWSLKKSSEVSPVPKAPSENITVGGVIYVGYVTSHTGSDMLCVVPGEAYVPNAGKTVTLNVTVKFKHAQPCPYSDWRIVAENLRNVEIVKETKTELKDPYTAFKQYIVKVLGNGSIDIVFKYGTGCPYGTEERATVKFYIGAPPENVNVNTSNPEELLSTNVLNITGIIKEINLNGKYVVVGNTTVYIKGRWHDEYGVEYQWRVMLGEVLKVGESVKIVATEENGKLVASEIIVNGRKYTKG
ncbi:hypothetical protein [Thermococcus sp.]